VQSYGSPVEPNDLHGSGKSQLGTGQIIVALGALYKGDSNKPIDTDELCRIKVSGLPCDVTVAEEETYRGGVVTRGGGSLTVAQVTETLDAPIPTGPALSGTITLNNLLAGVEVGKVVSIEIVTAGGSTLLETVNATLGASGVYNNVITTVAPGTYDLYFNASHWLKKKVAGVVLVAGNNPGINASLLNGDNNGDEAVTSTDLGAVKTNYLKTVTPGTLGDFNEDGAVTSTDLGVVKTNYLKAGDSY